MRRTISLGSILSCISIGLTLYFNISGTRQLIADTQPVLEAVLPLIGIVFLSFGVALITVELRRFARNHTEAVIADLDRFILAGKEYVKWVSFVDNALNYTNDYESLRNKKPKMEYRYKTLGQKHFRLLGVDVSKFNPSYILDSMDTAAKHRELLRAYGYIKGRWMICRDHKKNSHESNS